MPTLHFGSLTWVSAAATDNDGTNFSKAAGTTNGMENFGFSISDNRLTCAAPEGRTYSVTCTFSASCSGATEAVFALFKNGLLVDGTEINRSIGVGGDNGAGGCHALLTLKKDDYVELWCKSDNAADDITIKSGVLSAVVAG